MKIEGKVSLVTGGASGIGKALARRLLENGIKFVSIVDIDEDDAQETITEFSRKFGADRVRFFRCDVTDEKLLPKCFQETYDVHQALDIVANNAGILSKNQKKTIDVNLIAVMNGMIIANDLMTKTKRSEKGVIINTSSIAGFAAHPISTIGYTASKHGVLGLTRAFQCSSDGFSLDLRAVAICPALVPTKLMTRNDAMTDEEIRKLYQEFPPLSMSTVIDAFVQAIEDDTLSGAIIKVEPSGSTVLRE